MLTRVKFAFGLLGVLSLLQLAGYEIELPAGTPLFAGPEMSQSQHIPAILSSDVKVPVLDTQNYRSTKHPLVRKFVIYQVQMPDGKTFWTSDRIRYTVNESGRGEYVFLPYTPLLYGAAACFAVFAAATYLSIKYRNQKSIAAQWLGPLTAIICLHGAMLLMLLYTSGVTAFAPADEYWYFKIARNILDGDFAGPWRFTVGLPLFYLPFVAAAKAKEFYDIELGFSIFNAFAVMPVYLTLLFMIFKKLASHLHALTALLLLLGFMFFYQYDDCMYQGVFTFKSCFFTIDSDWNYYLHSKFLLFGYHAGSENLGNAVITAAAVLLLYFPGKLRILAIASALFGLSCLIRVNNIFMAPLIGWLIFDGFRQIPVTRSAVIRVLTVGALAFCGVFSLQWLINFHHFGSIFTFPYVLHDPNVYKGFIAKDFPWGFNYLATIMYGYLVPGLLAMFWIRDRSKQLFFIFWVIPLFFFFCGYPVVAAGSTRFVMIVYPGLIGALVLADFWRGDTVKDNAILLFILGLPLLLTAPSNYRTDLILPWGLQLCEGGATLAMYLCCAVLAITLIQIWQLRRDKCKFYFALAFAAVFFSGYTWTLLTMMTLLLMAALLYFVWLIWKTVRPLIAARNRDSKITFSSF